MQENIYWIWISRIKKVNNKTIFKLLETYKTPEEIYKLSYSELLNMNLKEYEIQEILKSEYRENLEKYVEYMIQNKIQVVSMNSKNYPKKLNNIDDKPIVLFIKGNKEILNQKSIAIIGCRDASKYGIENAEKMAYNLCKNSINIVSGLAIGIDSYAHIGALKALNTKQITGSTIAVIGNGMDNIYPNKNKKLADVIVEKGGTIISEYIIGTKPEKMNFPARNRIISGIADGVLVIEAKKKSGTLITVDFALEQGKEVFAIPDNITNCNSIGTNKLIKDGAILVTTHEDIINNLNTYINC